jgi:hypothetical protein
MLSISVQLIKNLKYTFSTLSYPGLEHAHKSCLLLITVTPSFHRYRDKTRKRIVISYNRKLSYRLKFLEVQVTLSMYFTTIGEPTHYYLSGYMADRAAGMTMVRSCTGFFISIFDLSSLATQKANSFSSIYRCLYV